MHELEPYYNWRDNYTAEDDERSPFYGREYSEMQYTDTIYNYFIHPQWDFIGSSTLYLKILFADYEQGFAIIEMIGEWNDALHNDIRLLKEEVMDILILNGINKFIIIGENVLNFHGSDDCYYEALHEDIEDSGGWIVALNFQEHVSQEMREYGIHYYIHLTDQYSNVSWRKLEPEALFTLIDSMLMKFIA